MADRYRSMQELYDNEPRRHYRLTTRRRPHSRVLILSPHGGSIEWMTSDVARQVAGDQFNLHDFAGRMKSLNFETLHVTSKHYDCLAVQELNQTVDYSLAIHGCRGWQKITYLGGQDDVGRRIVRKHLEADGFITEEAPPHLSGLGRDNIVNQNLRGMGIQLELDTSLRQSFEGPPGSGGYHPSFYTYCHALQAAMAELSGELE